MSTLILQTRICKSCTLEKSIKDFNYHKSHNCFSKSCKDCLNKKRRNKSETLAKEKGIERHLYRLYNRTKLCIKCREEKKLNKDNFLILSGGFSKVCRKCYSIDNIPTESISKYNEEKAYHIIKSSKLQDLASGRKFSLSREFVENSLKSKCDYCGFPSSGLDRIDNSLGHTEENCVPACKECNIARNNNFSHQEMKEIGKVIREIKIKRN